MDRQRRLVALVTFTLGLLCSLGPPAALAAGPDPHAPRVGRPDTAQRGEDPLQAPRGETR